MVATDEGAARLGEVALVDREGRIGPLDTVFYDTLLDENAASHIALGQAYELGVRDAADIARVNRSAIHTDFMIGSTTSPSPACCPAASRCRCCATDAGRSERSPARPWAPAAGRPRYASGSRRGAGAAERARLEIA